MEVLKKKSDSDTIYCSANKWLDHDNVVGSGMYGV